LKHEHHINNPGRIKRDRQSSCKRRPKRYTPKGHPTSFQKRVAENWRGNGLSAVH